MNKYFKLIVWLYVVIFIVMVSVMLVMTAFYTASSILDFTKILLMFVPSVVAIRILLSKSTPFSVFLIAIIVVLIPLSDAYKFMSMPEVTYGMYALLLPMLLFLSYFGLSNVRSIKNT